MRKYFKKAKKHIVKEKTLLIKLSWKETKTYRPASNRGNLLKCVDKFIVLGGGRIRVKTFRDMVV